MKLGKPGELVFPSLKALTIITGGFRKVDLKAIEGAHLPSLERLTIYFGTDRYGCDLAVKDLRTLLASERFPRLARLGLVNAELVDELCKSLHTSSLVAQVDELDLSMGTLSDEGARALATYAGGLAHLKVLDVSRSFLTARGIKMLTQAFPNAKVESRDQRLRGRDDEFSRRYVSISE
jgi:hypothetical protein